MGVAEAAKIAAEEAAAEAADQAAAEQAAAAKAAQEAKIKAESEAKAAAEAEAAAKRDAVEAAAIKKAEEDLNEQLRVEKLNAEIEEAHQQKQADVQSKFEEAKKKLEESGAEFVSNEEFAKVKAAKAEKAAGAA